MLAAVDNGGPYNLSLLTEIIAGVQGRGNELCSALLPAATLIRPDDNRRGVLLLQAAQQPRGTSQ